MRRILPVSLLLTLIVPACTGGGDETSALETDEQRASYAIGRQMGVQLVPAADMLDMPAFRRGVEESMREIDAALPEQELQAAMQRFVEKMQEEEVAAAQAEAAGNEQAGAALLADNAMKEGVVTTDSGLQYLVLEEGTGDSPESGDRVRIHYHGTLPDGTVFDSSRERGQPAEFAVDGVIPGFTEALKLMQEGGKARVWIPGDLAYGVAGRGPMIPPSQLLIFELELLEVLED